MIRARSKYTLTVPFTAIDDLVSINIYLWDGLITDEPTTATYTINKKFYDNTDIVVDVSSLIRDNLDPYTNKYLTWFSSDYVINTVTTSLIEPTLVSYGYLNPLDGENSVGINFGALKTSLENYTFVGSTIKIPYLKSDVARYGSIEIRSFPNGSLDASLTEQVFTTSQTGIQEITIAVPDEKYISISFGSLVYYIDVLQQSEYQNKTLEFINKFGVKDQLDFKQLHSEKTNVTGDKYYNSNGNVLSGYHNNKEFNKNSKESFVLESPFIDEDNNSTFKELFNSEFVWMGGVPVNITSTSITYKTKLKDKMISYTINVENSFNSIL